MKRSTGYILFLFFSFSSIALFAQDQPNNEDEDDDGFPARPNNKETGKKNYYLFSPRVNVTVPHPITNSSFKKCFAGIYEVSGGLNIMIYKGLFIGGSYKNGLLKITPKKIANYPGFAEPTMNINNAAGKIGGDLYLGERNRVLFSAALSFGQNWTTYANLVAKDPHKVIDNTSFTCSYYEPEVNLFFLIEDNFGVGATVTYTVFDHTFDPYALSLNDWAGGFDKTSSGTTQYLSFGFGIYYSFLKKKHQ